MKPKFVIITFIIMAVLILLSSISAWLLQENIAQFAMKPRLPFDTTPPPEAPDYTSPHSWIMAPDIFRADTPPSPSGAADIFFVHETTYRSRDGWNAPFSDPDALAEIARVILPNQAGPFMAIGPIYAPKYRQATMSSFFTQKHQGRAARLLAYSDIKRAFSTFLAERDAKKPVLLVGYGQGALHVQGLLVDFFQSEKGIKNNLVAAYVIGQSTPIDMFETLYPHTPLCTTPEAVRCVISYSPYTPEHEREIWRARNRHLVPDGKGGLKAVLGRPIACINPISWREDNNLASAHLHLGAASATGPEFGTEPVIIEKLIEAQCLDGILLTSQPPQRYLRHPKYFGRQWLPLNFNLFYEDLRVNAEYRTTQLHALLIEEENYVPPINSVLDIDDAPIQKIPD